MSSRAPDAQSAQAVSDPPDVRFAITFIRPSKGWRALDLRELWAYRELLYFLVWRDVKVRYKQTVLGAGWAIIQPVLTMIVFTVFFGRLAGVPSDGLPYPVFSLAALVPWTFFSNGLTNAANSLVASQALLKKVYFPRLALPVAAILSGLVDFAFAFAVLVLMVLAFGITPTMNVLWIVPLVLLALVAALGVGLWFAALNVRYRDVKYLVPFLAQLWLFATPIAYPSSMLSEPWRTVYALNPMAGVVEGFRWALLSGASGAGDSLASPGPMVAVSALAAAVILVGGAFYFRRLERTFADIV